ncbi:MAG: SoxR reducing system RseC family protein [Salinivirgaceae bacterium]|nr:SoxR reducing system RseC family protein [Salinivirgaceae bacterium]
MSQATISHQGIIESVTPENIKVRIMNVSACAACHVKGACSASDTQEKIIDALPNGNIYKSGDLVTLLVKESMGFKALFLGYLLPFLLVVVVLIIGTFLELRELIAGLLSLSILIPYYVFLFFFKDQIKKSFVFEIKQ